MLPPLEPESSASAIPPSPLADKSYITIGNMNCKEFFEKNKKFLSEVLSDFVSDTMERRYKTIVSHIEKEQYWEYNR